MIVESGTRTNAILSTINCRLTPKCACLSASHSMDVYPRVSVTVDSAVSSLEKEVDDSMLASLSLNNTSVKKQARKSVHDTSTVHVAKQRSALEDKADSTQEKGNLHNCDIRCDGNQETQDPDEHRPERASPLKLSQLSIAFDKLFNDGENKMEVVQEPTVGTPIENRISCPYKTRQELHVTYNNECARYEGLPPAWRALNVQFGLPLEAVPKRDVEGYEAKIPAVLQMMKEYLLSRGGVYSEGIFRLAPDRDECAAVKRAINDGTFTGCTDINVIANLIKVWFRELPKSLFSVVPDKHIYAVCDLTDPEQILRSIEAFPDLYRSLVLWLLDVMVLVVQNESTNKMTAKNMAIVMAPNLLNISSDNPMFALTMSQKVADFTFALLQARLQQEEHRVMFGNIVDGRHKR